MLTGDYWDGSLVLGFAAFDRTRRGGWRCSATPPGRPRAPTRSSSRDTRVDGVEIDSELSEIGRRYFDMNNPRLHLYHEDARPFIRRIDARYDVITVDAYRQPYIPFYLTTKEFFEEVRDRLRTRRRAGDQRRPPRGPGRIREGAERDDRRGVPVRDARPDQADQHADRGESRAAVGGACCGSPSVPPELRATAAVAGRSGRRCAGGAVYTDDKAPVEWLIDKSIIDYAAAGD